MDTALFDASLSRDVLDGALAFARDVARRRRPPEVAQEGWRCRRRRFRRAARFFQSAREPSPKVSQRAFLRRASALTRSPGRRATCRSNEVFALERRLFLELMQSTESSGLRHTVFAERAATASIPDVTGYVNGSIRCARSGHGFRHDGRRHRDELPIGGNSGCHFEMDPAALDRGVAMMPAQLGSGAGKVGCTRRAGRTARGAAEADTRFQRSRGADW